MLCLDATKYEYQGRDAFGRFLFKRISDSFEMIIVDKVRFFEDGKVVNLVNAENPSQKDLSTR